MNDLVWVRAVVLRRHSDGRPDYVDVEKLGGAYQDVAYPNEVIADERLPTPELILALGYVADWLGDRDKEGKLDGTLHWSTVTIRQWLSAATDESVDSMANRQ